MEVAIRNSGDPHPTVVNIELRQAWDGAWYPLVAQEGEPSFASHYVDSAQYFWELAASRTRKAMITSLYLLGRPSGQSNLEHTATDTVAIHILLWSHTATVHTLLWSQP